MSSQQNKTLRISKMAMLAAISIVLVMIIHFPIIPTAAFLEYDPADIPIFIGTFAFGPVAGVILTVIVSIIQGLTVSAGGQIWGIIMHIIATGSFAIIAGNLYTHNKSKKGAIIALVAGAITMTIVMCACNLVITPIYTGMPRSAIMPMIPTAILPFNLIKAGINSVVTFLLYKRISGFLHK
ncbi:MAG: ECF transporter S component [Clostridia bacterium]|nr:ECF transporter S component [Clostridia bacterium]